MTPCRHRQRPGAGVLRAKCCTGGPAHLSSGVRVHRCLAHGNFMPQLAPNSSGLIVGHRGTTFCCIRYFCSAHAGAVQMTALATVTEGFLGKTGFGSSVSQMSSQVFVNGPRPADSHKPRYALHPPPGRKSLFRGLRIVCTRHPGTPPIFLNRSTKPET